MAEAPDPTKPPQESGATRPPIALLIPVHNRPHLLRRALASVAGERELFDVILVDDGSEPPIALEETAGLSIHVIRLDRNTGVSAALNAGLDYIFERGYEYIARLDSDDAAVHGRFAKQLAFLRQHPDIGLVGSHFEVVSSEGRTLFYSQRPLENDAIRRGMRIGCMLQSSTLMLRTDVARQVGHFRTNYPAGEDYDYLWRCLGRTRVANLPDILMRYEVGAPDTLSVSRRLPQALNGLKVRLRYFDPLNAYSYLGLAMAGLELSNLVRFVQPLKRPLMRALFGEDSHPVVTGTGKRP